MKKPSFKELLTAFRRIDWAAALFIVVTLTLALISWQLTDVTKRLVDLTSAEADEQLAEIHAPPLVVPKGALTGGHWNISLINSAKYPIRLNSRCIRTSTNADSPTFDGADENIIAPGKTLLMKSQDCHFVARATPNAPHELTLLYEYQSVLDKQPCWIIGSMTWDAWRGSTGLRYVFSGSRDPKPVPRCPGRTTPARSN